MNGSANPVIHLRKTRDTPLGLECASLAFPKDPEGLLNRCLQGDTNRCCGSPLFAYFGARGTVSLEGTQRGPSCTPSVLVPSVPSGVLLGAAVAVHFCQLRR
jgi:hypothetical protein